MAAGGAPPPVSAHLRLDDLMAEGAAAALGIHAACAAGDEFGLVRTLERGRADVVHETDSEGRTPLHVAAAQNRAVICHVLLDWGARIHARCARSLSPAEHALRNGHADLAWSLLAVAAESDDAFIAHAARVVPDDNANLAHATFPGCSQALGVLLGAHARLSRARRGRRALHAWAVHAKALRGRVPPTPPTRRMCVKAVSKRGPAAASATRRVRDCPQLSSVLLLGKLATAFASRRADLLKHRVLQSWRSNATSQRITETRCIRHMLRRCLKDQESVFRGWRSLGRTRLAKRATLRQLVLIWLRRKIRHCFSVWVLFVLYASSPLGRAAEASGIDTCEFTRAAQLHMRNAQQCQHHSGLYKCLRNALGSSEQTISPRNSPNLRSSIAGARNQPSYALAASANRQLKKRRSAAIMRAWKLHSNHVKLIQTALRRYVTRAEIQLSSVVLAEWHECTVHRMSMLNRVSRMLAKGMRCRLRTTLDTWYESTRSRRATRRRLAHALNRLRVRTLMSWASVVDSQRATRGVVEKALRHVRLVTAAAALGQWRSMTERARTCRVFMGRQAWHRSRAAARVCWHEWRAAATRRGAKLLSQKQRRMRHALLAWAGTLDARRERAARTLRACHRVRRVCERVVFGEWRKLAIQRPLNTRQRLNMIAHWCLLQRKRILRVHFMCWTDVCQQSAVSRMAYTAVQVWHRIRIGRFQRFFDAWINVVVTHRSRKVISRKLRIKREWLATLMIFRRWMIMTQTLAKSAFAQCNLICHRRLRRHLSNLFEGWLDASMQMKQEKRRFTNRQLRRILNAWKGMMHLTQQKSAQLTRVSRKFWLMTATAALGQWRSMTERARTCRVFMGRQAWHRSRAAARVCWHGWRAAATRRGARLLSQKQRRMRHALLAWAGTLDARRERAARTLRACHRVRRVCERVVLAAWQCMLDESRRHARIILRLRSFSSSRLLRKNFDAWFTVLDDIRIGAKEREVAAAASWRTERLGERAMVRLRGMRLTLVLIEWNDASRRIRRMRGIVRRRLESASRSKEAQYFAQWCKAAIAGRLALRARSIADRRSAHTRRAVVAQVLFAWRAESAACSCARRKVVQRMRLTKLACALSTWYESTRSRRATRRRLAHALNRLRVRTLMSWASVVDSRRATRGVVEKALRHVRLVTAAAALGQWRSMTERARTCRVFMGRQAWHRSRAAARVCWHEWRAAATRRGARLLSQKQRRMRHALLAWAGTLDARRERAARTLRACHRVRRVCERVVLAAWQCMLDESRRHARIILRLRSFSSSRLLRKNFDAWFTVLDDIRIGAKEREVAAAASWRTERLGERAMVRLRGMRLTLVLIEWNDASRRIRRMRGIVRRRLESASRSKEAQYFAQWCKAAIAGRLALRARSIADRRSAHTRRAVVAQVLFAWRAESAACSCARRKVVQRMRLTKLACALSTWYESTRSRRATRRRLAHALNRLRVRTLMSWASVVDSRRATRGVVEKALRHVRLVTAAAALGQWRSMTERARTCRVFMGRQAWHRSRAAARVCWHEWRAAATRRGAKLLSQKQRRMRHALLAWAGTLDARRERAARTLRACHRVRQVGQRMVLRLWRASAVFSCRAATTLGRRAFVRHSRMVRHAFEAWLSYMRKLRAVGMFANRRLVTLSLRSWHSVAYSQRVNLKLLARAHSRMAQVVLRQCFRMWYTVHADAAWSRRTVSLRLAHTNRLRTAESLRVWYLHVALQMRGRYGLALKWIAEMAPPVPIAKDRKTKSRTERPSNPHPESAQFQFPGTGKSESRKPRWLPSGVALTDLYGALRTPMSGVMASKAFAAASPAAVSTTRRKSIKKRSTVQMEVADPNSSSVVSKSTDTPSRLAGASPVSVLALSDYDVPSPEVDAQQPARKSILKVKEAAGSRSDVLKRIESGAATLLALSDAQTREAELWAEW